MELDVPENAVPDEDPAGLPAPASEPEPESEPDPDPPLVQTPVVPAPEALAFTQVCEQLGFDPTSTKSITFSGAGVVAVAANYPEPFLPVEVSDGV